MALPSQRLPKPMAVAAQSDAVAMSMPAQFIEQNRRACPTAASRAMRGKARIGGSETAPKPTAATAAKKPVEKNVRSDHSRLF